MANLGPLACVLQRAKVQTLQQDLAALRKQAQDATDSANAVKARLQSELITQQQKMAGLQKERTEVEVSI